MEHHFVGQFDVALVEALYEFRSRESLFLQFRNVLVAVLGADLWLLRLAFGGYGGQVHFAAGDDWGRPAAAGDLIRPLDVFSLGPTVGESLVRADGIRFRSAKLRPLGVLCVGAGRD